MRKKKPIDKVTPELLSVGLRAVGIGIDRNTLDKIIDVVELIEDHGNKTSLKHVTQLESEWEQHRADEESRLFADEFIEQMHG